MPKGSPEVISALQALLAAEYHANLQFRNDTTALKFLGVPKLAKKFHHFADQSHEFYQSISKRLMVIGGSASAAVGNIEEQTTVTGLFTNALAEENALCALGIAGIKVS